MIIGEIIKAQSGFYIVLNVEGTLEKLPDIKWPFRLWLEIRQGMGKYFTILEARHYMFKHKK